MEVLSYLWEGKTMKCYICHTKAIYIMSGFSVCRIHYSTPQQIKHHTKVTHTPGPWKVEDYEDNPQYQVAIREAENPNGRILAVLDKAHEQDKATARLVASAPDLLLACQVAFDLIDKWKRTPQGADFFEVDSVLRKAIIKAGGVL